MGQIEAAAPRPSGASALDVLRAVVSVGLPGTAVEADEPLVLSSAVVRLAGTHRVQGLVWCAVEAGSVVGDADVIDQAREAHKTALRTCLISEEAAVLALEALGGAGVEARVLKGVAISHLDHDDPAERVFGDADLLVRRRDHAAALRALIGAGFERTKPPVRQWWERRFAKAIVLRSPSGSELDLHLAITGGYFGHIIDHDRLWATSSPVFDLGGHGARGLDREGRLLHACCHSQLGVRQNTDPGLRAKRDIAQLVLVSGADWRQVVERAEYDGVDLVVAEAVRATWRELSLDFEHPSVVWAQGHVADPQQQRVLEVYQSAFDVGWAPEGRGVVEALGPIDRVLFVAGLAAPSRASLRSRNRTWRQHLRLGWASVRSRA